MIFLFNCFISQIDIESTCGHPFFVYGKGWASYKPDFSLEEYGLKCQPLEVGDICISLRPREARNTRDRRDGRDSREHRDTLSHRNGSPPVKPQQPQQQSSHYMKHQYYSPPQLNLSYNNSSDAASFPQNLSRKQPPHTISTTATATAVTSRPVPPFDFQSNQYAHALQQQRHPMSAVAAAQFFKEHDLAMRQHYAEINALHRAHSNEERRVQAFGASMNGGSQIPFHRTLSQDSSTQNYSLLPPPLHLSLQPPPSSSADNAIDDGHDHEAIDATTSASRKRRLSAPDKILDVDGCQIDPKKFSKH